MDKLLPCPFCGGEAFIYCSGSNGIGIFADVHCKECHASTFRIKIGVSEADANKNIAIEAWNRRSNDGQA
jgi:Lar family restriction alleviation protein